MEEKEKKDNKENEIVDQKELKESLEKAIKDDNTQMLSEIIDQVYPIDIALALEDFKSEDLIFVIENTNDEDLASIIKQADDDLSKNIVKLIEPERLIKILDSMSNDDVVDILRHLKPIQRKRILGLMKPAESKIIENLLGHEEFTAGSIMTTEYIWANVNRNIDQVIEKIKQFGQKVEVIDTIFAVDDFGELIGTADLRDILVAKRDSILKNITDENCVSVSPDTDQEDVALLVSKYDLKVIPVVSNENKVLGIITVDDVIDVIYEEHSEDMLYMGGTSAEEELDSSISTSIKMRLPWLIINLFTAFLAAYVISKFEGTIEKVTALAAASPIVTGMGGNAASQQLAIMIRGIALGEVELKDGLPLVLKQTVVGIVDGAVTGVIAGIVLYFMYGNFYLGLIIFFSMILNLVVAGLVGVLIPLIINALHLDPALSSTIFITTATDVFGFFIFLRLAQAMISKLV